MKQNTNNIYKGLLGLSCVENNVLMFLRKEGADISYLYGSSEIGLPELFDRFILKGSKYEFFNGFERIQDMLKQRGILSVDLIQGEYIYLILPKQVGSAARQLGIQGEYVDLMQGEYYKGGQKGILILSKVKEEYLKEACKSIPWRKDHYMYSERGEDGYIVFYNDSPYYKLYIKEEELKNVYDNEYLKIGILRNMNEEDEIFFKESHKRRAVPDSWEELMFEGMENIEKIYERLRDLIGIYKVSRQRRMVYEGIYENREHMLSSIREIERLYIFTAYLCMKNIVNRDDIAKIVRELWLIEQKMN